jgi:putative spermidine/putrescine transport system permease protein
VAACILGTLAALGLTRIDRDGRRTAVDGIFAAPRFVPNVVIGFALLMAFSLVGIGAGFAAITCAHLLIVLPLVVRSVSAALHGIKPSLIDAAMSLGPTRAQVVRDVVIPLARTGIAVGFIFDGRVLTRSQQAHSSRHQAS